MKITILDDYQDCVRQLACFSQLQGHEVAIWNDHTQDTDELARRLADTEALVLIRERTPIRAPLIERLSKLRLISQTSVYPHIDIDACTRRGIVVSSDLHPGEPSYATAELTWGLILAVLRRIPSEAAALKSGRWQSTIGIALRGRTPGIFGYTLIVSNPGPSIINLMYTTSVTGEAQIKPERVKVLAVADEKRQPVLPDMPTLALLLIMVVPAVRKKRQEALEDQPHDTTA
jgi:hypothetical protein